MPSRTARLAFWSGPQLFPSRHRATRRRRQGWALHARCRCRRPWRIRRCRSRRHRRHRCRARTGWGQLRGVGRVDVGGRPPRGLCRSRVGRVHVEGHTRLAGCPGGCSGPGELVAEAGVRVVRQAAVDADDGECDVAGQGGSALRPGHVIPDWCRRGWRGRAGAGGVTTTGGATATTHGLAARRDVALARTRIDVAPLGSVTLAGPFRSFLVTERLDPLAVR